MHTVTADVSIASSCPGHRPQNVLCTPATLPCSSPLTSSTPISHFLSLPLTSSTPIIVLSLAVLLPLFKASAHPLPARRLSHFLWHFCFPLPQVTAHQLNVFLGGHVGGGKKGTSASIGAPGQQGLEASSATPFLSTVLVDVEAGDAGGADRGVGDQGRAAQPESSAGVQEVEAAAVPGLQDQWSPIHGGSSAGFEAVFDPSRVVRRCVCGFGCMCVCACVRVYDVK